MSKCLGKIYHIIPLELRKKLKIGYRIARQSENRKYKYRIKDYYQNYDLNKPVLYSAVEIETINRCNGKCAFCPVNVNEEQRPYAKMSEELFKKIVDELAEENYRGRIALFSNNEPFLDERMVEWNGYLREKLPEAYIYLYTNGTLLTIGKLQTILPYLDEIIIDNYNDNGELNQNLIAVSEWCKRNELGKKVNLAMRLENEVLTSRGGGAPNKIKVKVPKTGCFLPFQQLIIRPDGKVSLCCNDALGKYTLGDINLQSIREIWESDQYIKIRKELIENGRKRLMLCNKCDTKNYV